MIINSVDKLKEKKIEIKDILPGEYFSNTKDGDCDIILVKTPSSELYTVINAHEFFVIANNVKANLVLEFLIDNNYYNMDVEIVTK